MHLLSVETHRRVGLQGLSDASSAVHQEAGGGCSRSRRCRSPRSAATMLQQRSFTKKTKKGKVVKVRCCGRRGRRDGGLGACTPAAPAHRLALVQLRPALTPAATYRCTQVVREHYLRDDIYSGSPLDPQCPPDACKLSGEAAHYLLVDTNVALHQVGPSADGRGWGRIEQAERWGGARQHCGGSPSVAGSPPRLTGRHRTPTHLSTRHLRWTCWSMRL